MRARTGNYRKKVEKRGDILFCVFVLLYLVLVGRLAYIQVYKNDYFVEWADKIRTRELRIDARRGSIYDRCGRELAINVEAAAIYVQPKLVQDEKQTLRILSELTGISPEVISRKCSGRTFAYVCRHADPEVGDQVRNARLPGVGALKETRRLYPSGGLAAHIIGFTDIDGAGIEGIERKEDRFLRGRNGYVVAEIDAAGRIIPETKKGSVQPVHGRDVILTIDSTIQGIAEEALKKTVDLYKPKSACAIVMDTRTGEILALANAPFFDANDRKSLTACQWRNRAVTDLYEPGSTLKTVTVAAAIEEGLDPRAPLAKCDGKMQIGKRTIRCVLHQPYLDGHGATDMYRTMEQSCNIAAASAALRLGAKKIYSYQKAFGLLDSTGSRLPGEVCGRLESPQSWADVKLANIGFGQGICVTPLQMVAAYSAIANGGILMRPQVIREVRDSEGQLVQRFAPVKVRQVVSHETAGEVARMLVNCVENGTGKPGRVDGYWVAAKTGSAQKAREDGRGYASGKFISSFIGFLPAYEPRIAIAVVVDEPQGAHWGSVTAGPVFHEIAGRTMWYLRVPPERALQEEGGGSAKEC